jgi:hypothetical protein
MKADKIKDWYVEIEQYTHNDALASAKESFEYLDKSGFKM